MDGAHNNRCYKAGDTVKLELVLHRRANLREVRLVFEHTHDKSVAPLIARGRPHPISERASDGSSQSCLQVEIVMPGALPPASTRSPASAMRRQGDSLKPLP